MQRVSRVFAGAVVFLAAHAIEARAWGTWFAPGGEFAPWFLNSGRAVAFTAASLFVAALLARLLRRRMPVRASERRTADVVLGAEIAAGAAIAMAMMLAFNGPGTIFPLVLAVGAAIVAVSAIAGALVGGALAPSASTL
jgi:hypothetical protein